VLKSILDHINKSLEVKIVRYSDKLHKIAFEYGWGANILVCSGADGILLVDSGYRATMQKLQDTIHEISDQPIRYIIVSHPHSDHVGGNALAPDAKIITHINSTAVGSATNRLITFENDYSLTFNGESIRLISLPYGHSVGDILVYFANTGVAYFGDLYLSESFPTIGSSPELSVFNLLDNLKKARKLLPIETKLVSGHGRDTKVSELDHYILMVEETIAVVVQEIKKGKTLANIRQNQILNKWLKWSGKIWFITANSWISDIYASYKK